MKEGTPGLSYIITTYNKLPYLKVVLSRLIANCKEDEEIIVTDGASSDGTPQYLEELYKAGKIHQYISEKDSGEAHGFNKGMLMAKGDLIKILSDDDVFLYPLIQQCKEFMLENPHFDVMGGNIGDMLDGESVERRNDDENFRKYTQQKIPFHFNGQPLMIRKNSLSLLGFLDTNLITVDIEYTLRITSNRKVKMCWLSDILSVRIDNTNSNYNKFRSQITEQINRLFVFYNKEEILDSLSSEPKKTILKSTKFHQLASHMMWLLKGKPALPQSTIVNTVKEFVFEESFAKAERWILNENDGKSATILY